MWGVSKKDEWNGGWGGGVIQSQYQSPLSASGQLLVPKFEKGVRVRKEMNYRFWSQHGHLWIFPIGGGSLSLDLYEASFRQGETLFLLFIEISRIMGRKQLGQFFWIIMCIYYYRLNGIELVLDLDNSCWIQKIPKFTTNKIKIALMQI